MTPAVPAPPQNVRAIVVAQTAVALTWDDPEDSSVSGYRVERRGGEDAAEQFVMLMEDSGSAATHYIERTVLPASSYVYRVRAINAAGLSAPSDEVRVNTQPASAVVISDPDRDVLVALYRETDGPNWAASTNWLSDRPLGEWYGVTTDADGRVIGLSLDGNLLYGTVPEALGDLSKLAWLDLSRNRLYGTVPEALGDLSKLTHLYLAGSALSGCIPISLSRVPSNDFASMGLPFCQQSLTSSCLDAQVASEERWRTPRGNLNPTGSDVLSWESVTCPQSSALAGLRRGESSFPRLWFLSWRLSAKWQAVFESGS